MLSLIFIGLLAVTLVLSGWHLYDVYLDRQYAIVNRPNPYIQIFANGAYWTNVGTTICLALALACAIASLWWAVLMFISQAVVIIGLVAVVYLIYKFRKQLLKNRKSASVGRVV